METPKLYPFESFIQSELSKPGVRLFMYGSDQNGIPFEHKIIEIDMICFDSSTSSNLRAEAEAITNDDEKKQRMLDFANSGDRKLVVKVVPASHASSNYMQNHLRQMIDSTRKLPQEFQTYVQLKQKNDTDDNGLTDDEYKQYQALDDKLRGLPVNKLKDVFTDDQRFLQLRNSGVKLKRKNADCSSAEELELLRIYRRLDEKKRRMLQNQIKQQNQSTIFL